MSILRKARGGKRVLIIASVVASVLVAPFIASTAAFAVPFTNGNFETPVDGGFVTYTTGQIIGTGGVGWKVVSGSVDHGTGPGQTTCQAGSSTECVDLNGNSQGAIEQTFDTAPGAKCTVTYWMAHHRLINAASMDVAIDGTVVQSNVVHNGPATVWQFHTFAFTASGPSTTLKFSSDIAGAAGPQLDNVTLTCALPPPGTLKVCKVAGAGVPIGTNFTFSANGGTPFTVPAGPGPGGYCNVAGQFPANQIVTVQEAVSSGNQVATIGVAPSTQLVSANPTVGNAVVKIGPGVTEVTFTNRSVPTGYIEICKRVEGPFSHPGDLFHFDATGVPGGVNVPAGACSPPILVTAGTVSITEAATSAAVLVACSVFPSTAGSCSLPSRTATVTVPAGGLSTQVIITFTNFPRQSLPR